MKIQSPWMGRVKGSAGNMTGCKVYDKNVLRAKAFEVSNPSTTAQQTERNFFTEVAQLSADVSADVLSALFPTKPKNMSRRNAYTKQIAACSKIAGTEKTIDFDEIKSLGNAPEMDMPAVTIEVENNEVLASWDETQFLDSPLADNYAMIAVVNKTKQNIVFCPTNENLSAGSMVLQIGNQIEENDDCYAMLYGGKLKKGGKIALVGFGTMGTVNRPAR